MGLAGWGPEHSLESSARLEWGRQGRSWAQCGPSLEEGTQQEAKPAPSLQGPQCGLRPGGWGLRIEAEARAGSLEASGCWTGRRLTLGLLSQEIFGPVLTVYVYPDDKYKETLRLVDSTTSYGLTGAVFAQDK